MGVLEGIAVLDSNDFQRRRRACDQQLQRTVTRKKLGKWLFHLRLGRLQLRGPKAGEEEGGKGLTPKVCVSASGKHHSRE